MPKIVRNKTDLIEIAIKKLHMTPKKAKAWVEDVINKR
jgi:hypothetical protein